MSATIRVRVDWAALWDDNVRFAYVKATESTTYENPSFAAQYNGSFQQGMIRGAYHFALPDRSQAAPVRPTSS
ncbi:hypothetical protein SANTM175S_00242 [Streptomyces antimycoticus]